MAKEPTSLIYGVDDKPPLIASVLLGLQHVFVMTSGWVMVVVVVTYGPARDPSPRQEYDHRARTIGGLGIHLVRKLMDGVEYKRQGEKNFLTMTKKTQES